MKNFVSLYHLQRFFWVILYTGFLFKYTYAYTGSAISAIGSAHLGKSQEEITQEKKAKEVAVASINDPYTFYRQEYKANIAPSEDDIREAAFNMLKTIDSMGIKNFPKSVIDDTTWSDLNLLKGSQKHPEICLGNILNRTSTHLGGAYFLAQLAQPTDDLDVLKQRQALAHYWVDSAKGSNKNSVLIDKLLALMPKGEVQLLLFDRAISSANALHDDYFQYFGAFNDVMNENEVILDGICAVNKVATPIKILNRALIPITLLFYSAATFAGLARTKIQERDSSILNFMNQQKVGDQLARSGQNALGGDFFWSILGNLAYDIVNDNARTGSTAQSCAKIGLGLLTLFYGTKLLATTKDYIDVTKLSFYWAMLLHEKIYRISQYVRAMEQLDRLVCEQPELRGRLKHFELTHAFFTSTNEKIKHLQALFKTKTFNKPVSSYKEIYHHGRVLVAYKLLLDPEVHQSLAKAMFGVAEIDSSLSVAKLYNEQKEKRVKYCFVDYIKQSTPHMAFEEFWNPFVDADIVVTNSLHIGVHFNCPNMVITGANSSGKSTVLKSIALALIMAQSLGIAPATSASMTPFHYIATYMGITDDIADKASLHQAETDRTIKLEAMISNMPHNQFSFVMFDELFSGTNPAEGASLAYATTEVLGSMPHCISIIASHFPKITSIEAKTSRHRNYRVAVDELPDGSLKRLYKLEPGISHQHVGIKVARERGCSGQIIDRAEEIHKEISEVGA